MRIKKDIVKATGLYTLGNIFNRAISLLILPIFTRLLSTSSYGIVSTYNSWVNIATVVVGLQLYLSLRSAFSEKKDDLDAYISSIDGLILLSFIIISIVTIPITRTFLPSIPIILVILCLVHSLMRSFVNVELQREMMSLEYIKRTLLLSAPNLIAAIIGITVIIIFPNTDYYGRIGTNVLVYLVIGLYLLFIHIKKGKKLYNKEYWKYGIIISFPLIFHGLAADILSSVDKTMITAFRSSSETGIYSVSYTLGMAIQVITTSVEAVWIPWFTQKMQNSEKKSINDIGRKYLLVVTCLCISSMMCLPEVLKLFSEKSYWDGIYIIPPVVMASYIVFLYSISVDVEYYYKATKGIAVNTFIAAGLNLLLNWILIPKYGALAAAYTTVFSYAVSFLIHQRAARKLDNELFPVKIYTVPIVLSILATIFTSLFMEYWYIRWFIAVCVIGIILIFVYKGQDSIYRAFKNRN